MAVEGVTDACLEPSALLEPLGAESTKVDPAMRKRINGSVALLYDVFTHRSMVVVHSTTVNLGRIEPPA